jgi:hypothetical protein
LRKLLTVVLVAIGLLVPVAARADSVMMTLTSPGSGNNLGGAYIGPYVATINSVPDFEVICDDFKADTYQYESWYASTATLADVSHTNFKNLTGYEEVAYLSSLLLNPGSSCGAMCQADIQYAIWAIFDTTAPTPFSYIPSEAANAQAWIDKAVAYVAAPTFNVGQFSNFIIYTPTSCISGQCSNGALPQEFVAFRTPEPASVLLFGVGLVGLLAYRRRQEVVVA